MPTVWEYYTVEYSSSSFLFSGDVDPKQMADTLNRLGSDGWELISAAPLDNARGTRALMLIFKRPCLTI